MPRNRPYPYLPSEDVEAALRGRLPEEELPIDADLGIQEADMPGPEALGAYTNIPGQVGQPTGTEGSEEVFQAWGGQVSDEQAQRWMEEREIYDAQFKIKALVDESRDYKQDLIDEHYAGLDPSLRNTEKLGKELGKMEVKTARMKLMEAFDKEDIEEMTPQERLALLNVEDQAKRTALVTVRQQKQDDIATLSQAVSEFNAGQKEEIAFTQQRTTELQAKHATQEKAAAGIMEAQVEAQAKAAEKQEKQRKQPTRADIQAIHKAEVELTEIGDQESGEFKNKLKVINGMRKVVGLPPLTKTIIRKAEKKTFLGVDLFWPDVKEEAKYSGAYAPRGKIRKYNPATRRLE